MAHRSKVFGGKHDGNNQILMLHDKAPGSHLLELKVVSLWVFFCFVLWLCSCTGHLLGVECKKREYWLSRGSAHYEEWGNGFPFPNVWKT